ncbi:hypothetical protein RIF29_04817 [Crotalaria pallida]|uniref:Uncharacterized protein n=1 Tax=Crotalaria pallida TaxID=3830 RepID=A0AAN9J1D8_CROPI
MSRKSLFMEGMGESSGAIKQGKHRDFILHGSATHAWEKRTEQDGEVAEGDHQLKEILVSLSKCNLPNVGLKGEEKERPIEVEGEEVTSGLKTMQGQIGKDGNGGLVGEGASLVATKNPEMVNLQVGQEKLGAEIETVPVESECESASGSRKCTIRKWKRMARAGERSSLPIASSNLKRKPLMVNTDMEIEDEFMMRNTKKGNVESEETAIGGWRDLGTLGKHLEGGVE